MSSYFNQENVLFDNDSLTQEQAFKKIAQWAVEHDVADTFDCVVDDLNHREAEASTGFEDGFAIPHARTKNIKQVTVLIVRFKNGIEWKSMDGKLIRNAFCLLVPEAQASDNHIKILSTLATLLMDSSFRDEYNEQNSAKDIVDLIECKIGEQKKDTVFVSNQNDITQPVKHVVAITACAAGIAHTYMAEKALIDTGKKMGYEMRVETQGSVGVEHRLTEQEIATADFVIIASDIKIDLTRFANKRVFQTNVKKTLEHTVEFIENAEKSATILAGNLESDDKSKGVNEFTDKKTKKAANNFGRGILKHIMSGISYMLPLLVASGILIGIARISALIYGDAVSIESMANLTKDHLNHNGWFILMYVFNQIGTIGLSLIYVLFAMFIAYSIADKPGIVPGFIAGFMCIGDKVVKLIPGLLEVFPSGAYPFVDLPSGFLGALFLAFLTGYFVKFLNHFIRVTGHFQAVKPMLILPALGVIFTVVFGLLVITPIFGLLNKVLQDLVRSVSSVALVYALVIAALTAFDLGGPVNKAAGAVAIGMATDHILPLTSRVMSIIIPPIGLGLSSLIDKLLTGRRVYDRELTVAGRTSFLLGFIGVSEGALPFLFKNPMITAVINMLGAIFGSLVAVSLGAEQWYPLPAIWGWPLVTGQIWAFYLGLVVGIVFIALVNIALRWFLIVKNRIVIDNDERFSFKEYKANRIVQKQLHIQRRMEKKQSNKPMWVRFFMGCLSFCKWIGKSLKITFSEE